MLRSTRIVAARRCILQAGRVNVISRCLQLSRTRNVKEHDTPPNTTSKDLPLHQRLSNAWKNTPTKWYPLPVIVGALLLVAINWRKNYEKTRPDDEPYVHRDRHGREVIRLRGPWQVHVIGALPLRNLSRLWGYLNSLELPVWFRPIGFRIYAFIFGCNLDEVEHDDLRQYTSLGDFFYRRLKEGVRPIDNAGLVSPADGKVLHFGTVKGLRVEQVKGLTYSLQALLGSDESDSSTASTPSTIAFKKRDHEILLDQEFANVNGIEYTLDQLLGASAIGSSNGSSPPSSRRESFDSSESSADSDTEYMIPAKPKKHGVQTDASVSEGAKSKSHDQSVADSIGAEPPHERAERTTGPRIKPNNQLFFVVIYLAPGDYHRFHSPCAWVVEKRRHFIGELFSVSPYMAKRLANLFVLNERVSLLGRWKYGFFSMVPVGATNVGSILLNFDKDLRTNIRGRVPPPGNFTEAVYSNASTVLRGQPLRPGEEMGGFCLGSTIVMVFEAPKTFSFNVRAGQKVKVGQMLGDVDNGNGNKP